MNTSASDEIDFEEVFDALAQPLAVCDPDGWVLRANANARAVLGVARVDGVRLQLDNRDTLSAIRVRQSGAVSEFFMADVLVEGAGCESISVSVASLEHGGFRVHLVEETSEQAAPHARMLHALASVVEPARLFQGAEQQLSLLASCLLEVFPECAFRVELEDGSSVIAHERGYSTSTARTRVPEIRARVGAAVDSELLLWVGSASACVLSSQPSDGVTCRLQAESRRARGFSDTEQLALELFLHHVAFMQLRQRGASKHDAGAENLELVAPIIEQLGAAMAVCDARRAVRSCNETFAALTGDVAEQAVGQDVLGFVDEPSRDRLRSAAAAAMSGAALDPLEIVFVGHEHPVSVHVVSLVGETNSAPQAGSPGFLVLAQPGAQSFDVLQDQIAQAEHLMQIGQLASGVAHELKNPLTSIMNYADYLLRKYRDQLFEERDSVRLMRIIEGVERMDQFIRDLVLLARPASQEAAPEPADLHEIVTRAVMLCEVVLDQHNVSLELRLRAEHPRILASANVLVQVFVNLLTNAAAAMDDEGGVIEVSSSNDGERVWVEIADNGCGIEPDAMARIFEPFFTTRRHAGGSGLGLPLVKTIVERHAGQIDVTSAPGVGTTFSLRLPLYHDE